MTSTQALTRSLVLLNGGKRWTKGSYKTGRPVQYCAMGALRQVAKKGYFGNPLFDEAKRLLEKALPRGKSVVLFNDHRSTSWRNINALFKRAISLAKKQEKPKKKAA